MISYSVYSYSQLLGGEIFGGGDPHPTTVVVDVMRQGLDKEPPILTRAYVWGGLSFYPVYFIPYHYLFRICCCCSCCCYSTADPNSCQYGSSTTTLLVLVSVPSSSVYTIGEGTRPRGSSCVCAAALFVPPQYILYVSRFWC